MAPKVEDVTAPESRIIEDDTELPEGTQFDLLRALGTALGNAVEISATRIPITKNGSSISQFVDLSGVADEETLQCLEESVLDIVYVSNEEIETIVKEDADSRSKKSTNSSNASSSHGPAVRQGLAASIQSVISSDQGGSFFSIPSCNSNFDDYVDPELLNNAEAAITDLENNGPAGFVHLSSLSAAIDRPIKIWSSGNENSRKVGRTRTGEAVDIEYHEPDAGETTGHWTLRNNEEPRDVAAELNDCLFAVVADQIHQLAPELRAETLKHMRKHVKSLANRIQEVEKRHNCDRISLLIGGACYNGSNPNDAKGVLDRSQKGRGHWNNQPGHPRGHTSDPNAEGPTDSAENYSRTGMKSAFLSKAVQDEIAHLVLSSRQGQEAMRTLNNGQTNIAVRMRPEELRVSSLQGIEFYQGVPRGPPRRVKELVIVFRHHAGQVDNPNAEVFVLTFYPVLE